MAGKKLLFACGHEVPSDVAGDLEVDRDMVESIECPDCRRAKLKAKETAQCWPRLKGDAATVEAARLIRSRKVNEMSRFGVTMDNIVRTRTNADWWIDVEYKDWRFFEGEDYLSRHRRVRDIDIKVDWARLLARKEATIFPDDYDGKKPTAKVGGDMYLIWSSTIDYSDDYLSVVRGLGYKGNRDEQRFELKLSDYDGDWYDRMAELGAALLDDGFVVECYNAEARQRMRDRSFEPRIRNWIDFTSSYGFVIITPKQLLKQEALHMSSAVRRGRQVHVRPEFADEVADFAEYNDFKLTDQAAKAIEEYRRAVARDDLFISED